MYTFTTILGSVQNDLNLITLGLFFIGFAALELSVGLLLMIFFNKNNKTLFLKNFNKSKFDNFFI